MMVIPPVIITLIASVVGFLFTIVLAIIAYFMKRSVNQQDDIKKSVDKLNTKFVTLEVNIKNEEDKINSLEGKINNLESVINRYQYILEFLFDNKHDLQKIMSKSNQSS